MLLALDIGNTRTKIGLFQGEKLVEKRVWAHDSPAEWATFLEQTKAEKAIFCSVAEPNEALENALRTRFDTWELTHETPLPFRNAYRTPHTLGKDRLAASAGAQALFPGKNCLVVDCGTCIKYELLSADGTYLGGNIAPGAAMRLRAMHHFTARLPEAPMQMPDQPLGDSTESALQNGALRGAALEIQGFVQLFSQQLAPLQVVLTGGDAAFFAPFLNIKNLKTEPDLTLFGLRHILNFNLKKAAA
jgi:type III pantothenate kinase